MTTAVLTRETPDILTWLAEPAELSTTAPEAAILPVQSAPTPARIPSPAPRPAAPPPAYSYAPIGPSLMEYWGLAWARSLDLLGFWTYLGIQAGPPTGNPLTYW